MKFKQWCKNFFTKENLYDFLYLNAGILLVAISVSFFLDPNHLVMGGATGLAILFNVLFGLDTAIGTLIINAGLLIIGLIFLGKEFFIKTLYGSLMLPVYMFLTDFLYSLCVTEGQVLIEDNILVIIFSSLIMGLGIGMVMKKGGTTGGTEVPQQILLKYCHIPFSVSLFLIDGVIVLLGVIFTNKTDLIIDVNMLLYAIVFIYISGVVMDQIVFSGFNSRAVYIISEKNDLIKERIIKDFERGVTEIPAVGGYTGQDKTELVCVMSSNEFYKLKAIIHEIDPLAFFYAVRANEVNGEGFTRRS